YPVQSGDLAAVGVLRRADQNPARGQLRQPLPGDGEANIQLHLIADEHPRIVTFLVARLGRDLGPGAQGGPTLDAAGAGEARCAGGIRRTGQYACRATWSATEPTISRVKPPAPREPTTSMSASLAALMSSSTTKPWTALTVTDSGRGPSRPASTLSVSAWAAVRASSVRTGSSA